MKFSLDLDTLFKPIQTKHFELVPVGRWRMARQVQLVEEDSELRESLFHRQSVHGFVRTLWRIRRSKIPRRLYHEIIDRSTGETIGFHVLRQVGFNTATLTIVIYDRSWWGKGAVVEIRKKLIVVYHEATGVSQFSGEVHCRNFSSIFNYKKLGFENVGIRYSCAYDYGSKQPVDYFSFSLRGAQLMEKIKSWKNDGE